MKRIPLFLLVVVLGLGSLGAAPAPAQLTCLAEDGYLQCTYVGLDAVTTAAEGTPIYLGPYDAMLVIPQSGIDSSNTYDVNCGFSASKITEPTVFDEVLDTTNTMDGYVMPTGHQCEWVRVDKVADDGTATTIHVVITRKR